MGLQGVFYLRGKRHKVSLNDTGITWEPEDASHKPQHVPINEILSCWLCPHGSKSCCPNTTVLTSKIKGKLHKPESKLTQASHPTDTKPLADHSDNERISEHESSTVGQLSTESSFLSNAVHDPHSSLNLPSSSSTTPLVLSETPTATDAVHTKPNPNTHPPMHRVVPAPVTHNISQAYEPNKGRLHKLHNSEVHKSCSLSGSPSHPCHQCSKPGDQEAGLSLEVCERVIPLWLPKCCNEDDTMVVREWKTRVLVFKHVAREVVDTWHVAIWRFIQALSERPWHVAVVVNPWGGRRRAPAVYASQVAPLLHRASITATVYQTTHCGHGRTLVEDPVITEGCDGVLVVGGDGLAGEVATGLLVAAARRHQLDVDDPKVVLPDTGIRIGVIPAGTTNSYVSTVHGTMDVTTAVLHVIMGSHRKVDVAGLYHYNASDQHMSSGYPESNMTKQHTLERFAITGVHMGYLGGIHETANKLRWMGPLRDIVGSAQEIVANRSYKCRLKVLLPARPLSSPLDTATCTVGCTVCTASVGCGGGDDDCGDGDGNDCGGDNGTEEGTWVELDGNYSNISNLVVSLECKFSRYGMSPAAHLGDGTLDLVLFPQNSCPKLVAYIGRTLVARNHLHHQDIRVHRCSEARYRAVDGRTPWNCDGELFYATALTIKVHRQRLDVFCRGIEVVSRGTSAGV